MLPFEFVVQGVPVSAQTRNRSRLQAWRMTVRQAAQAKWPSGVPPVMGDVEFCLTYYYDQAAPDVDNIIKPIQDALVGVVYVDDNQVANTSSRKRDINGSYRLRHAPADVVLAFSSGGDFIHIVVRDYIDSQELTS